MKEVQSTNISHVGHEGTTLKVRFHSGAEWHYADVPSGVFDEMMHRNDHGESIGKFFHARIKPHYKAMKQEEQK